MPIAQAPCRAKRECAADRRPSRGVPTECAGRKRRRHGVRLADPASPARISLPASSMAIDKVVWRHGTQMLGHRPLYGASRSPVRRLFISRTGSRALTGAAVSQRRMAAAATSPEWREWRSQPQAPSPPSRANAALGAPNVLVAAVRPPRPVPRRALRRPAHCYGVAWS